MLGNFVRRGEVLCVYEDGAEGEQGDLRVPGGGVGCVVDDEVRLLAVGGADGRGEEGELDPGFVQVRGDERAAGAGFGDYARGGGGGDEGLVVVVVDAGGYVGGVGVGGGELAGEGVVVDEGPGCFGRWERGEVVEGDQVGGLEVGVGEERCEFWAEGEIAGRDVGHGDCEGVCSAGVWVGGFDVAVDESAGDGVEVGGLVANDE